LIGQAPQNAGRSRDGIHLGYPEFANMAAFDCSDCMPLHTGETQSRYSYLDTYDGFAFNQNSGKG
jgi:hypothetical protein